MEIPEIPKSRVLDSRVEIEGRAHFINRDTGIHSQVYARGLDEISPVAVLGSSVVMEALADKGRQPVWIDFFGSSLSTITWGGDSEILHGKSYALDVTLVATRLRGQNCTFLPIEDLLTRVEPLSLYTQRWMRLLLLNDVARPPLQQARTDAITELTSKLPPLTTRELAKLAITKVPSIRASYEAPPLNYDVRELMGGARTPNRKLIRNIPPTR